MNNFVAVDFETSYEKGRDIKSLGTVPYLRHASTDIYLVSFAFPDGTTWAGDPAAAPWDRIKNCEWLSHNRSFDLCVHQELCRRGMSLPFPDRWHCTADLMAYIQAPRSLAGAAREMLKTGVSKVTRDEMKGQDYRVLPPARQRVVQEYARSDALLCWMLWRNHNREWPEHERWLSEHTTRMGLLDGIGLDLAEVESGLDKLKTVLWDAERAIPWAADHPITSIPRLHRACRDAGIPPPVTTDAKSEEFDIWADEYATRAPFVAAVQKWRRANRLAKVLEAMRVRYADGRLRYQFKYFGAQHTGRFSGDSGLNLQNLPRKGFEGVDLRSCLVPKPGHVFISSDLSQIEARVLLWLANDDRMLARLRTGEDLYESHARVTMGYTDPRPLSVVDPDKRQFAKCRCLGLGFGLGSGKFVRIVKQWTGKDITPEEAKAIVRDFREKNAPIVKLWRYLERMILNYDRDADGKRIPSKAVLPSGREIRYFDLLESGSEEDGEDGMTSWAGRVVRGEPRKKIWGGLLSENVTQATARDILAVKIRESEDAGMPVVLHVHDEIVVEVPEADAEEAKTELNRIMSTAPDWAPGLPVKSDTKILRRYGK